MNPLRRLRRSIARRVPRRFAVRFRLFRRSLSVGAWNARRSAEAVLVSYPKCGRTWLRMMLGHALANHYGFAEGPLAPDLGLGADPRAPRIQVSHDDDPHWKRPARLRRSKRSYRRQRVVFLVRDPRDVVVSMYFERTRRERAFSGTLEEFLGEPVGSLETLLAYYNIWAACRGQPSSFLLVRYEDLKKDAAAELRRILDFLGVVGVADGTIAEAVEFGAFDNMRAMEMSGSTESGRLRPRDPSDPESFKTRRGVVGGYVEYLDADAIERVERRIAEVLDPVFGY